MAVRWVLASAVVAKKQLVKHSQSIASRGGQSPVRGYKEPMEEYCHREGITNPLIGHTPLGSARITSYPA